MRIKDFYLCSYYMHFLNHGKTIFLMLKKISTIWFQDHHLTGKHHMNFLNRLSSKEIHNFLISQNKEKTSSRRYYQKKLNDSNLDLKNIYLLVRIVTKDRKLRAFQFKLLNNVLYLNKMLFKFSKI